MTCSKLTSNVSLRKLKCKEKTAKKHSWAVKREAGGHVAADDTPMVGVCI
jgi:hypothetical protein